MLFFGRKRPSNQVTLSVKIIKQIKANQFLVADAPGYRKIEQSWQENGVAKKFHKQQKYIEDTAAAAKAAYV